MRLTRKIRDFYKSLSLPSMLAKGKPFVAVFNYHQVTRDFDSRYHNKGTWTNTSFFAQQLRSLKKRIKIVPLTEALDRLASDEVKEPIAAITLDDGDQSLVNGSLPVLKELCIPATIFINTAYLDDRGVCWFNIAQFLKNSSSPLWTEERQALFLPLRKTMDSNLYERNRRQLEDLLPHIQSQSHQGFYIRNQDIESIQNPLIHIGLHGHEHQRFSMMSAEWQKESLRTNRDLLASHKNFVPIFAIPFGRPHDWTPETLRIAEEQKLRVVFANGGLNFGQRFTAERLPSDSQFTVSLLHKQLS